MVYYLARGRLGNIMLLHAAAAYCAKMAHTEVCAVMHEKHCKAILQKYPMLFHDVKIVDDLPGGVPVFAEKGFSYCKIPVPEGDFAIYGTYLSEKYFDRDAMLQFLPHTSRFVENLRQRFGIWLDRPNITSIHVRRGDYIRQMHLFPFVGKNYYRKCLAMLPECNDYIVCTDDPAWCRKFFNREFSGKNFLIEDNRSVLDDLWLQTLCKNNIIANSTYSWWGAVLNEHSGKRVFAPSMWFGFALSHLDTKDVYSPGWEVINNDYDFCDNIAAHLQYWGIHLRAFIGRILRRLHVIKSR